MTKSLITIGLATLLSSMITGCDVDTRALDIDPAQVTAQVRPSGDGARTQASPIPGAHYDMQLTSGDGDGDAKGRVTYLAYELKNILVTSYAKSGTNGGGTLTVNVKSGYDLAKLKAVQNATNDPPSVRLTGLRQASAGTRKAEDTIYLHKVRIVDLRENRDGSLTLVMTAESASR